MTSGSNDDGRVTSQPGTETAVLAGGCFWGMEDLIRKQPGAFQIALRGGVLGRRVALVARPPVVGVPLVQVHHQTVPLRLGEHARGLEAAERCRQRSP